MKLSTKFKVAIAVLGALPVAFGAVNGAFAADDPTSGRLAQREYQKCVDFSKRVLQAALASSKGDRDKINSAYAHYQGNERRCRARYH